MSPIGFTFTPDENVSVAVVHARCHAHDCAGRSSSSSATTVRHLDYNNSA